MRSKSSNTLLFPILFSLILSIICFNFTIDDTYISLRYAKNLAQGHGLVFNTDQSPSIEGYTNLLWVLIESVGFKLYLSDTQILTYIKVIGIFLNLSSLILINKLTYILTKDKSSAYLSALIFSLIPLFPLWAVGGLETPLYIFLILASLYLVKTESETGKLPLLSTITFLLLSITRPEGILIFLTILITQHIIYKKPLISLTIPLTLFLFPYINYLYWKYSYYGQILPNTFFAKQSTFDLMHFQHRSYQLGPLLMYLSPLIIATIIYIYQRNQSQIRKHLLFIIPLVLLYLTSYIPHTEWMPGYRYELPFITFLIILASPTLVQYIKQNPHPKLTTILISIYLLIPSIIYLPSLYYTQQLNQIYLPFAKWLKTTQATSYASWDLGIIPYYSQIPTIIDIYPEALLNTQTHQHGYNPQAILETQPQILTLPHQQHYHQILNPHPMFQFYELPQFQSEYQYIFSLEIYPEYIINVYHHKNFPISQSLLDQASSFSAQRVLPEGIEPPSSVPETDALSIKLREPN